MSSSKEVESQLGATVQLPTRRPTGLNHRGPVQFRVVSSVEPWHDQEDCSGVLMGKKAPNPIDKHVGNRVRMRRLMLRMSQEKLGDGLGLTFQQVQKYEKGTNRIGASRLQNIAHILQVPVAFFFEEAPHILGQQKVSSTAFSLNDVSSFVASSDGLRLIKAFVRIDDPKLRRRIVHLVEGITDRDNF
jgi:transcriptional regulator with XRE-family HTH domain